jgi:hypothetical protein
VNILTKTPEVASVTLIFATAIFSFGFSVLRLHRRFGSKTRYALKSAYARWALAGCAVLSGILSLLLSLANPSLGSLANTIPGAILLAVSSSAIVVGATSVVGVRTKDQKTLVSVSTWVYDTIDPQMEQLIKQEIAGIARSLRKHPRAFETLCSVGITWVNIDLQFAERKLRQKRLDQLKVYALGGVNLFDELVGFLLNECQCDPEWLHRTVKDEAKDSAPAQSES